MTLEGVPLKLIGLLCLALAATSTYLLRQATLFGLGGSELLHRLLGVVAGVSFAVTAVSFELHAAVKYGAKLAAILSPLFLAIALGGLYMASRVALFGRDTAKALLSAISEKGFA